MTLRVEGEERELPAGLDVTAYRVIQDALAAALEHGGAGRAEVRVRFSSDTLEIVVRDDGPASEARPLMGIRERVVLHGGRLTAGPRRAGGHAVRATLPLDGRTVPEPEAGGAAASSPACAHRRLAARALWRWLRRPTSSTRSPPPWAVAAVVEVLARPTARAARSLNGRSPSPTRCRSRGAGARRSPPRPSLAAIFAMALTLDAGRAPLRAVRGVLAVVYAAARTATARGARRARARGASRCR